MRRILKDRPLTALEKKRRWSSKPGVREHLRAYARKWRAEHHEQVLATKRASWHRTHTQERKIPARGKGIWKHDKEFVRKFMAGYHKEHYSREEATRKNRELKQKLVELAKKPYAELEAMELTEVQWRDIGRMKARLVLNLTGKFQGLSRHHLESRKKALQTIVNTASSSPA